MQSPRNTELTLPRELLIHHVMKHLPQRDVFDLGMTSNDLNIKRMAAVILGYGVKNFSGYSTFYAFYLYKYFTKDIKDSKLHWKGHKMTREFFLSIMDSFSKIEYGDESKGIDSPVKEELHSVIDDWYNRDHFVEGLERPLMKADFHDVKVFLGNAFTKFTTEAGN